MNFLLNHNSLETAYQVGNYPYGGKKCQIKFWIEKNKKGARFCSQTQNPKTGRWNNPKYSTYAAEMVMFLDEKHYVDCAILSVYDDSNKTKSFLFNYEDGLTEEEKNVIQICIAAKERMEEKFRNGSARWEISGKPSVQLT
jgi:hypothetical protein